MAKKPDYQPTEMSLPIAGMLIMGVLSAVVVAAQCEVIKYWPLPVSIAPPFGWDVGFWWGLIVGGLVGLFLGYIVDEKHYSQ